MEEIIYTSDEQQDQLEYYYEELVRNIELNLLNGSKQAGTDLAHFALSFHPELRA